MPQDAPLRETRCRHLVQSQGWREGLLVQVLDRVAELDRLASTPTIEAAVRLEAVARKAELLALVQWAYRTAQEPNPFEVMRGALYGMLRPGEGTPAAMGTAAGAAAPARGARPPQRGSGGLA